MWYSFQGSTLNVLLCDPLERIFSFFLSLSAIPRELIQHSDFQLPSYIAPMAVVTNQTGFYPTFSKNLESLRLAVKAGAGLRSLMWAVMQLCSRHMVLSWAASQSRMVG